MKKSTGEKIAKFVQEQKHTSQLIPTCPKCFKQDLNLILGDGVEGGDIIQCDCGCKFSVKVTYRYTTRIVD